MPFEDVVALVGRHLPSDAIVTVDAGTFGAPVYRVIPFAPPQRLLAPDRRRHGLRHSGRGGAAGLREPGRPVIAFVGDGGFLMTGSELAVAMERKLPLKVILSENQLRLDTRFSRNTTIPAAPSRPPSPIPTSP